MNTIIDVVCPRCNHKNFGEDRFCEECLFNLTKLNIQHFYTRWDWVVVK